MSEAVVTAKKPFVQIMQPGTFRWCRSGRSQGQPFWDGSHSGTEFLPMKMEIAEALCLCERNAKMPYGDGTHGRSGDR